MADSADPGLDHDFGLVYRSLNVTVLNNCQYIFYIQYVTHYIQLTCFMLGVNTNNQNEAKLLFRGHCPLHVCRRFIGAMVPEAPLDHKVWA